jgi:hypothetical protein
MDSAVLFYSSKFMCYQIYTVQNLSSPYNFVNQVFEQVLAVGPEGKCNEKIYLKNILPL